MTVFHTSGNIGTGLLRTAYERFKAIKPTSVESERIFSNSSQICTKIRSRMDDETLDSVVFLRTFFQQKRSEAV